MYPVRWVKATAYLVYKLYLICEDGLPSVCTSASENTSASDTRHDSIVRVQKYTQATLCKSKPKTKQYKFTLKSLIRETLNIST